MNLGIANIKYNKTGREQPEQTVKFGLHQHNIWWFKGISGILPASSQYHGGDYNDDDSEDEQPC